MARLAAELLPDVRRQGEGGRIMSEHIIDWADDLIIDTFSKNSLHEPVVRCRDCKYYYEVDEYHPQGNYDRRCCKYFDTYSDEVEPNGFCAWGEKK